VKKFDLQAREVTLDFRGRYVATGFALFGQNNLNSNGLDLEYKEVSISKAVGEFLERTCTYQMSESDIKLQVVRKKTEFRAKIKTFCDYHRQDFFSSIPDSQEFAMLPVQEIFTNQKVLYPAQLIFWGKNHLSKDEPVLIDTCTSGCAGGFTYTGALVSAVYENVERDSFFCHWLTKTTPNEIEIDLESPAYKKITDILQNTGFEIHVFDSTTDVSVPSCFCLLYSPTLGGLGVTGSARLNMKEAVESALVEMFFMFGHLSHADHDVKKFENYVPFQTKNINRTDRLNYWAKKKDFSTISFLFAGGKRKLSLYSNETINSKQKELETLLSKFKNLGREYDKLYAYEVKNEVLKVLGYHVVRVIVPKLYPLYLVEDMALTESVRLGEFNLWKNGTEKFTINPEPHPFP
jgi:ribosomal protein S12 methylthiotransferase accessory factor